MLPRRWAHRVPHPPLAIFSMRNGQKRTRKLIAGFIGASREAKALLARSDEDWQRLSPVIKAEGRELDVLRDRYREGIPKGTAEEEEADAAKLYAVLAELGGPRLVGPATTLAPGTFWKEE